MIAGLHGGDAGADLANDARALMAEDGRKNALAVETVERIGVGMADAGRLDLDQDFAGLRPFQVELDDLQRLLCLEGDGGACLHLLVLFRFSLGFCSFNALVPHAGFFSIGIGL